MRTNIIIVVALIFIAGIILGLTFVMKPMPKDAKVSPDGAATAPETTTSAQAKTPSPKSSLDQAFEKGIVWMTQKQLPSGAFPDLQNKDDVAFTAMALIILGDAPESIRLKYKDVIDKGLANLAKNVQPNGSIMDAGKMPSFDIYKTSLAVVALKTQLPYCPAEEKKLYEDIVSGAVGYMQKSQFGPESADENKGGWGYDEHEAGAIANVSTSSYVLDALHKSGLAKDSETYKRAIEFLAKCQDSSEYNKYRVAANTGGFYYSPVESKANKEPILDKTKPLTPYGSMTYAGLLSLIYASVDKNDPRVQSAYNWIRGKYTLDENPGLRTDAEPNLGKQGLFYYYHSFAKALDAYGEKKIVTTDNMEHYWANDIVAKLVSIQAKDGHWSNEISRWWEDLPILATSYSLMTLNICRKWVD